MPAVVILDDDPTGTQAVSGIPVITRATPENVRWALEVSPAGFFILTNSRSLDEADMTALTREVVATVLRAAGDRPVRFVSRSDSTLRGHIVAEPDAVRAGIADAGMPVPPATLWAPAFPAAGRVTRGGVHLLREGGAEHPAHESHYATDATFGYATSSLPELVEERSGGAVRAADVPIVPAGEASALAGALDAGGWVAADASTDEDLEVIARALDEADPRAERVVVRCSPGLLPALLRVPPSGEMPRTGSAPTAGGLVIVGSHVARTTRQLARLVEETGAVVHTLDVEELVDADDARAEEVARELAARAAADLATSHVVIATARAVRTFDDPERSLAFARRVSDAVVATTRHILRAHAPAFVVAKGGITSSDTATRALEIERAIVRGRVGAGIVWEPVGASVTAPFALVPGNIGGDDGLLEAVRGIAYQRSSAE